MKSKKRGSRSCWIAFLVLVLSLLIYSYASSRQLIVTLYKHAAPVSSTVRIVQLTDLHNYEYGENNDELVQKVAEQKPDMIVMTGDMLNRDDPDLTIVKALISRLVEIAPLYYGYGNHETIWEETFGTVLHEEFTALGAVVLDNEYSDIEIKENAFRIGGYMGYYWQPHMMTSDPEQQKLEKAFFHEFEDTERYKILLNHIPTQWVDWEYVNLCPVDVVFSGHFHGGVVRIPFTEQGLFAPYVGLFPRFTKGMDEGIVATCVLSAGLGSERAIPRLNNPPEIVVLDLIPSA